MLPAIDIISLFVSTASLFLAIRQQRNAVTLLRERQDQALQELSARIFASLTKRIPAKTEVAQLATAIREQYRLPPISPAMVCEALRRAYLRLDDARYFDTKNSTTRREGVLALISDFQGMKSLQLSIANTDRVAAFVLSGRVGAFYLIALALLSELIPLPTLLRSCLLLTLVGVSLTVLSLSVHLTSSLQPILPHADTNRVHRLSALGNLIGLYGKDHNTFWNILWAPIWEQYLFVLRGPRKAALLHEFRYQPAKQIARRALAIQHDLDLARYRNERFLRPEGDLIACCQELWVYTGIEAFNAHCVTADGVLNREALAACYDLSQL